MEINTFIDNEIATYKYNLLQKELLEEKMRNIEILQNKGNNYSENILNFISNIDLNTIIKGTIIILGIVIVTGIGYSMYTNSVNTSYDMSKTVATEVNKSFNTVSDTLSTHTEQIIKINEKLINLENKNVIIMEELKNLNSSFVEIKMHSDFENYKEIYRSIDQLKEVTIEMEHNNEEIIGRIIKMDKEIYKLNGEMINDHKLLTEITQKTITELCFQQSNILSGLKDLADDYRPFKNTVRGSIQDLINRSNALYQLYNNGNPPHDPNR